VIASSARRPDGRDSAHHDAQFERAPHARGVIVVEDTAAIIDVRHNGIGDVVVACWVVCSAAAVDKRVRLNPRDRREVASLLGVSDDYLTSAEAPDWSSTPGIGHQLEYQLINGSPQSRFDVWCRSLNLPKLTPVRPAYIELPDDGEWADEQWHHVDADASKPRVLVFPDAAWPIRAWPKAYFIDLAVELLGAGCAVAAMGGSPGAVEYMPCHWWGGFSARKAAAMAKRARVVVANESGPSHLASAVGTRTIAICGPTDPRIVFAHEPNVHAVSMDPTTLPCTGCHFSHAKGYRLACDIGGCQALMRLIPTSVAELVHADTVAVGGTVALDDGSSARGRSDSAKPTGRCRA
jgi:Glycosyltransferase family 9 (heptosyltransferase)